MGVIRRVLLPYILRGVAVAHKSTGRMEVIIVVDILAYQRYGSIRIDSNCEVSGLSLPAQSYHIGLIRSILRLPSHSSSASSTRSMIYAICSGSGFRMIGKSILGGQPVKLLQRLENRWYPDPTQRPFESACGPTELWSLWGRITKA